MYFIETHSWHHAKTIAVIEKGDSAKTYEEFAAGAANTIINHLGGVKEADCKFCAMQKRAALLKSRKAIQL